MELNKNHREIFIEELKSLLEKKDSKQKFRNASNDQDQKDRLDVDVFIINQNIEIIEKSLIDNEIDF
jgi:hypothetical protein